MADLRSSRDEAIILVRTLRGAGHVAYFAGGCVRDELLGLTPKDYDVATDAPPDKVRLLFRNSQAVGAAFGVILVRINRSQIEVATFRSDGAYEDGRRPASVRFTTAEEDAQRRDFTINGMFLDPLNGEVIDYVGGQADLAARRLRAIGDAAARFSEDHLRLLRAVRFAARFNLQIENATDAAIRQQAPSLARISPERIADELRRMLIPPTRTIAYAKLVDLGLLNVVLRYLPGTPTPIDLTTNLLSSITKLADEQPISFGLALAAVTLQHRLGAPNGTLEILTQPNEVKVTCTAVRKALKISNQEEDKLAGVLSIGWLLEGVQPIAPLKRFLAKPHADEARQMLRALNKGIDVEPLLVELNKTEVAPLPLLTGDDLMANGFRAGPAFKRILDEVYNAQLEDRIATKEAALEMAAKLAY